MLELLPAPLESEVPPVLVPADPAPLLEPLPMSEEDPVLPAVPDVPEDDEPMPLPALPLELLFEPLKSDGLEREPAVWAPFVPEGFRAAFGSLTLDPLFSPDPAAPAVPEPLSAAFGSFTFGALPTPAPAEPEVLLDPSCPGV